MGVSQRWCLRPALKPSVSQLLGGMLLAKCEFTKHLHPCLATSLLQLPIHYRRSPT